MGRKKPLMAAFSIGEIEQITGIKAHVLRYWETVIPSLIPQKDLGNRRVYSNKDVQIILRLKYLIQNEKYTIEGARNRIIDDLNYAPTKNGAQTAETIALIQETRADLLEILSIIHSSTLSNKEKSIIES